MVAETEGRLTLRAPDNSSRGVFEAHIIRPWRDRLDRNLHMNAFGSRPDLHRGHRSAATRNSGFQETQQDGGRLGHSSQILELALELSGAFTLCLQLLSGLAAGSLYLP